MDRHWKGLSCAAALNDKHNAANTQTTPIEEEVNKVNQDNRDENRRDEHVIAYNKSPAQNKISATYRMNQNSKQNKRADRMNRPAPVFEEYFT
jgi:hypothetical protein